MAGAKRIHPVTDKAIAQARYCLQFPEKAAERHGQAYCDWMTDTVIGRLVAQQLADPDQGPSDAEIRGMIMGLAVGFVPTGAGGGGGILEVLLKRPGAMKRAKAAAHAGDDETLERILLEAMRFKPPILPGLPRYVVKGRDAASTDERNKRVDKIPAGATILRRLTPPCLMAASLAAVSNALTKPAISLVTISPLAALISSIIASASRSSG